MCRMPEITVHRLYYGPVGSNGIQLKTSSELRKGHVLNDDAITDIYTLPGKHNDVTDSSELIYTVNGPVIRVTRIEPLKSDDNRTVMSCNKTFLIQLSDVSRLLLPFLDNETTFPLKEIRLKVAVDDEG